MIFFFLILVREEKFSGLPLSFHFHNDLQSMVKEIREFQHLLYLSITIIHSSSGKIECIDKTAGPILIQIWLKTPFMA